MFGFGLFGFGKIAWLAGYVGASLVSGVLLIKLLDAAVSPFFKVASRSLPGQESSSESGRQSR